MGMEIRRARRARDWTQAELAEHAGVSVSSVSNAERDVYAAPDIAGKLRGALGLPEPQLVPTIDPVSPEVVNLSRLDDEELLALFHAELTRRLSARDGELPADVDEHPMSAGVTTGKDQATEGKTVPQRTTVSSPRKRAVAPDPGGAREQQAQ